MRRKPINPERIPSVNNVLDMHDAELALAEVTLQAAAAHEEGDEYDPNARTETTLVTYPATIRTMASLAVGASLEWPGGEMNKADLQNSGVQLYVILKRLADAGHILCVQDASTGRVQRFNFPQIEKPDA